MPTPVERYADLQRRLTTGWNTWNTRSVLSHVLLPQGLALNLGLREYRSGFHLREALIGRFHNPDDEKIHPGPKSYDGSYSDLHLTWRGIELRVESALDGDDLVLLITPLRNQLKPATLTLEAGFLWNHPGHVARQGPLQLHAHPGNAPVLPIHLTATPVDDPQINTLTPYLAASTTTPIVIATNRPRTPDEARALLDRNRAAVVASHDRFGPQSELHAALQTCMAWDTIYEPAKRRAVSTVSRIWNTTNGGFVLFCWDTFFAAYLASPDSRDVAYANAVEMLREKTPQGFVPNTSNGGGFVTRDRSQPPVGSMMIRELYRRFRDDWLVQLVFDDLLAWNRWWTQNRMLDGLLAWGSNHYAPVTGNEWETPARGVHGRFGGALESGLDNSPMYDDVPFSKDNNTLLLQDVGLNGLYVADCDALADLADAVGRPESKELRGRADTLRQQMQRLWSEQHGLFLNRRTDTGEFSTRISPTNFYALLGKAATESQAQQMIDRHFYNPDEFWGEHVLPSISRNDPAFPEQKYWRGPIWAPMNFLTYLGLRNYPSLARPRADLARKSAELLLREWRQHGHVHENYTATTGIGCDRTDSDRFYHWGGLLGLIGLIEAHHLPCPESPL